MNLLGHLRIFRRLFARSTPCRRNVAKRKRKARTPDPRAKVLKDMLLEVYTPQVPFTLEVTDRRPKTRMGLYFPSQHRILVHTGWHQDVDVALHEFAHHIHHTEKGRGPRERPHGREFKCIYSTLVHLYNTLHPHATIIPDQRYFVK